MRAGKDAESSEEKELVLGKSKNGSQKRTGRPTDWTQDKADKFIEVLGDSCNVSLAARAIGRSVSNVYKQRVKDAAFRNAWDQALAIGYARLEMMMLERALHGVEKTVVMRNGESRIMREYNDRVALALLRHHRDSVSAFEASVEDDEYAEACERIIEKLARLREQDGDRVDEQNPSTATRSPSPGNPGEERIETKVAADRLALIALALKQRRSRR